MTTWVKIKWDRHRRIKRFLSVYFLWSWLIWWRKRILIWNRLESIKHRIMNIKKNFNLLKTDFEANVIDTWCSYNFLSKFLLWCSHMTTTTFRITSEFSYWQFLSIANSNQNREIIHVFIFIVLECFKEVSWRFSLQSQWVDLSAYLWNSVLKRLESKVRIQEYEWELSEARIFRLFSLYWILQTSVMLLI